MPVSRKRKTKKKLPRTKKTTETSIQKEIGNYANRSIAPDPVKMDFYEVDTSEFAKIPFEERLENLRISGSLASKDFPLKFQTLKDWFKRYDQLYILAFTFNYFMTSKAGYDEEATTGELQFPPHHQELLQAFALTLPRHYGLHPFAYEVEKFRSDFKEIGELIKNRHLDIPDHIKSRDDFAAHQIRVQMMMHTIAVRNWSFEHKMKEVTIALAKGVGLKFSQVHGFDPEVLLEVLYKMTGVVEEKINAHRQVIAHVRTGKTCDEMMDLYESLFPVAHTPPGKRLSLWDKAHHDLEELQYILTTHADLFLPEALSFDFEGISLLSGGRLSVEQIAEIMKRISLGFGDLADYNEEHFLLNNPIHEKPFIRVSEMEVFTTLWTTMTDLSIGILEKFCLEDPKLAHKYNEVRAKFLEDAVYDLFKQSFPMATLHAGSQWNGKDGKLYENDLLVIIDNFAIVVEAKSGQVSPKAKRGAPDRLNKTLSELIEEPSEQALRFIEYLQENPSVLSLKVRKGPNNIVDASKIKYFIPLGVTLSHLHSMSSNLKLLIQAGVTTKSIEELAPSMSLTDLQIVFDLLPSAAEKVHYLQRRREIEANLNYMGTELDLLAWYFDKGFNYERGEEKYGAFDVSFKGKELDNYIIGSANGEVVVKPGLPMTQWWRDMITRMESNQPQSWLANSYILLNITLEGQEIFEEQVAELRKKVLLGTAPKIHNWILMGTAEEERQFAVAGYCYEDKYFEDRNPIIYDILDDERIANTKGKLVIGINVGKDHYPYSVLACELSTALFDNKFLKMTMHGSAEL